MESRDLQCQRVSKSRYLSKMHHVVLADGKLVYEGQDVEKMRQAFYLAGRSDAIRVSHLVNGVEMTFSFAV